MLVSVPLLYVGGGILAPGNLRTSRRYAPKQLTLSPSGFLGLLLVGSGMWDFVCACVRTAATRRRVADPGKQDTESGREGEGKKSCWYRAQQDRSVVSLPPLQVGQLFHASKSALSVAFSAEGGYFMRLGLAPAEKPLVVSIRVRYGRYRMYVTAVTKKPRPGQCGCEWPTFGW